MKIHFVTSNQNKLQEAKEILERDIESISLDIDEIQAIYVKDVIKNKAKIAYQQIQKPVIVEDTGLYIKEWNDFPGALIRWVTETISNEQICKLLNNRNAYAETCICLYDGKEFQIFSGKINGIISEHPRGKGFGWDSIFQPEGYDLTFAEMGITEKNKISMRKKAFLKLKDYLNETGN